MLRWTSHGRPHGRHFIGGWESNWLYVNVATSVITNPKTHYVDHVRLLQTGALMTPRGYRLFEDRTDMNMIQQWHANNAYLIYYEFSVCSFEASSYNPNGIILLWSRVASTE